MTTSEVLTPYEVLDYKDMAHHILDTSNDPSSARRRYAMISWAFGNTYKEIGQALNVNAVRARQIVWGSFRRARLRVAGREKLVSLKNEHPRR